MESSNNIILGIYEKALPSWLSWKERLETASKLGYQFIEMSVDESDERMSRLDWSREERLELLKHINSTGVPILSLCLSAHRKYPIGSENKEIRNKGMEIMKKAIEFSRDTGIRVIQLAAYDVFYNETSNEKTREIFFNNLKQSVEWAGEWGVTLALETMDSELSDSVSKLMRYVRVINSPWLQIYPDVGNLAASRKDPITELLRGEGHIAAIHLKDTEVGVYRRVPFGTGIVPFVEVFKLLNTMDYKGFYLVEMWGDDEDGCVEAAKDAREWIMGQWNKAFDESFVKMEEAM